MDRAIRKLSFRTKKVEHDKGESVPGAVDLSSICIGPRGENGKVFEDLILRALRDHIDWRKEFHPEDKDIIDKDTKNSISYQNGIEATNTALHSLLQQLRQCLPFYSPRYIGHMISDPTMASMVGYFAAMLYNSNNCNSETRKLNVTVKLELEIISQLATMVGYTDGYWGHLTSGGTIANFEALWAARNAHYLPVALYWAAQELKLMDMLEVKLVNGECAPIGSLDLWQLLNISSDEGLRLVSSLQSLCHDSNHAQSTIRKYSLTELGVQEYTRRIGISFVETLPDGVVVVPSTGHYSWAKICGAVGIGSNQLIRVQNDKHFRMVPDALYSLAKSLSEERRSIIACVVVLGSTEVGAIDPVHEILEARNKLERELGMTFYVHVDAAYGGYAIATTRCKDGSRKAPPPQNPASSEYQAAAAAAETWPNEYVYNALCAVEFTDSVTIDPHKLGKVPYPSGSIIFRNGLLRHLLAVDAPYVFHEIADEDNSSNEYLHDSRKLGRYTLEGSKPGAAAAAVWLSHEVLPLNEIGYGHLFKRYCYGTRILWHRIQNRDWHPWKIALLPFPDLNIICFGLRHPSLRSLPECNSLVKQVYIAMCTPPLDFMLTETVLRYKMYGLALHPLIESLGFYDSGDCYMDAGGINVLRCTVMDSLFLYKEPITADGSSTIVSVIDSFLDCIHRTMEMELEDILLKKSARNLPPLRSSPSSNHSH